MIQKRIASESEETIEYKINIKNLPYSSKMINITLTADSEAKLVGQGDTALSEWHNLKGDDTFVVLIEDDKNDISAYL